MQTENKLAKLCDLYCLKCKKIHRKKNKGKFSVDEKSPDAQRDKVKKT